MNVAAQGVADGEAKTGELQRTLTWRDAFWVACGVPAYLLFSIGAIAATVGQPAWLVWVLSVLMGFVQAFTYAEIAGLFPNKSGGASVYGAIAWIRYGKLLGAGDGVVQLVCLGAGAVAGRRARLELYADAVVPPAGGHSSLVGHTAQLGAWMQTGLQLRISAGAVIAVAVLFVCFMLQLRGASQAARTQAIFAVVGLLPLLIISIVPLVTGDVAASNLLPLLPLSHDAAGHIQFGSWNAEGWTLMLGGMFIAGYSTYGFETAICYTGEFRDPRRDTVRAILYSGLLCIAVYSLVPLAFQGHFGLAALTRPGDLRWLRGGHCARADAQRRRVDYAHHRRHAGVDVDHVGDDRDDGLGAHAVSSLGRRLVPQVPVARLAARGSDACFVDQPRL